MVATRRKSINFKELADIRLLKPERTMGAIKDPNTLYDVEIVERCNWRNCQDSLYRIQLTLRVAISI